MEETYQDGAGVGLVVDKERGVFRIHACTYHRKRNMCAPTIVLVGEVGKEMGVGGNQ